MLLSYDVDINCLKCGMMNEINYGQFCGLDAYFNYMPKCKCWNCGEIIQLDLNKNQYKIKETKLEL